jgi:hypothetical protein
LDAFRRILLPPFSVLLLRCRKKLSSMRRKFLPVKHSHYIPHQLIVCQTGIQEPRCRPSVNCKLSFSLLLCGRWLVCTGTCRAGDFWQLFAVCGKIEGKEVYPGHSRRNGKEINGTSQMRVRERKYRSKSGQIAKTIAYLA